MSEGKNYRILGTVASGGTAVLYRAIQLSLDRVVALKRLHQHLTQDENFTRRFILEAKAAASLDHQNIVRVIDFGVEESSYQMVMEFVEGESLKDVLDAWRPVPHDFSLAIVHQICRGLEHAHAKGIVHRDIKPGNVMLTRAGVAKITDFGLAKLTQGNTLQTAADSILGTPLYMSPEQAFGESVDQRSDLFSLGTVLYELLTGRQPFVSENYMGVIQNIIHKEIPAVRDLNPEVPPAVENIVMRALAKNRDERFASAREFREAIEKALGLEGLMRATAGLPTLLENNGPTRVLSKAAVTPSSSSSSWRTVSNAHKRKHARRVAWAVAPVLALALAGAGWYFWPQIRSVNSQAVPGVVQHSAMSEITGFDPADTPVPASENPALAHMDAPTASVDTVAVVAPSDTAAKAAAEPAEKTTPAADTPAEAETPAQTAQETKPADAPASGKTRRSEPEKEFREGYLLLNVEPSAQVFVNGVFRGTANPSLRLTLPVGLLSVECRAPNHEPYLESLRVVQGEMSRRNIMLKKHLGIISLATTEGAELYIDGEFVGITPILRAIEVPAGVHTVTIKKDRYYAWTSDVTVEANATLPLHITLSPRY